MNNKKELNAEELQKLLLELKMVNVTINKLENKKVEILHQIHKAKTRE